MTLRSRFVLCAMLALSSACPEDNEEPIDAAAPLPDAAQRDGGTYAKVQALDVLFVIDNSGSMADEQVKLAREIPRMVNVLVTGDRWAGREKDVPPGLTPEQRSFAPVRSLHMGLVSTNMGGLVSSDSDQPALASCAYLGDDAVLRNDTTIAAEGVIAKRSEFEGYKDGETVLSPDLGCRYANLPLYQGFELGDQPGELGRQFACEAKLGVRGCPFEQPLEAMWKALAPSARRGEDPVYEFAELTGGQGDRKNKGFLRDHAALVVILLTDEDDCSIPEQGRVLYDLTDGFQYGPLNARCGLAQNQPLLHGIERYSQGLLSLKPGHPERVVFAAIAGVPEQASALGFAEILALPDMQFRVDLGNDGLVVPSCTNTVDARPQKGYPAIRLVKAAQALGDGSVIASICSDNYGPAVDRVVDRIAPLMGTP